MTKDGVPIIFIHRGNSSYLSLSLYQAKQTNPNSLIFLITTQASYHYGLWVNYVNIEEHSGEADELAKIYRHKSINSHDFELICLQRWFVLKDFLTKNKIEQCIYLDSDVLVYKDLTVENEKLKAYAMTILGISPHTNFLKRNALTKFCDFIKETYLSQDSPERIQKLYQLITNDKGENTGVSDMSFFYQFKIDNPHLVLDISKLNKEGVFDITVDTANGFEMDGKVKKIDWISNVPFVKYIATGEKIPTITLHFQGSHNKKIMPRYIRPNTFKLRVLHKLCAGIYFFQRAWGYGKRKLNSKVFLAR